MEREAISLGYTPPRRDSRLLALIDHLAGKCHPDCEQCRREDANKRQAKESTDAK